MTLTKAYAEKVLRLPLGCVAFVAAAALCTGLLFGYILGLSEGSRDGIAAIEKVEKACMAALDKVGSR